MSRSRRTPVRLRLVAVLAAGLLLLALVVALSRDRNPVAPETTTLPSIGSPSVPTTPTQTSTPTPRVDPAVLENPDLAEEVGADAVLAAGRVVARDNWLDLTEWRWHGALVNLRPVHVGRLVISERTHVEGDVVLAVPPGTDTSTALRWLPGSDALRSAGAAATLDVSRDGEPVEVVIENGGALVRVPGAPIGEASLLRLRFAYDVPDRGAITDDGGPAGFGILARTDGVTMLGHAFPVLTYDDAPMVAWGDVGAFPVAIWSVMVEAEGTVVTGGSEAACFSGASCTWVRGTTLRDLPVAVFDDGAVVLEGAAADGSRIRAVGTSSLSDARGQRLLDESVGSMDSLSSRLGPLPWRDVEFVLAPLTGAAGMEFPGLVIVDPEYLDRLDGEFGTFVIAHEAGHQWFHALVGNSSLSESVVDESLAQYISLWYYRDAFGDAAAQGIVDRYLEGRYDRSRAAGIRDVAPASPLAAFASNRDYAPMTYARAPFAWLVAEATVGEEAIVDFLVELIDQYGLRETTAVEVRDLAEQQGFGELVAALDRWWWDPAPANDEVP